MTPFLSKINIYVCVHRKHVVKHKWSNCELATAGIHSLGPACTVRYNIAHVTFGPALDWQDESPVMVKSCPWAIYSLCVGTQKGKWQRIAVIQCMKEAIPAEISCTVTLSGAPACCPLCCDQCKPRSHGESLDMQVSVHASPAMLKKLGWGWTSFIPKWWDTDLNLQQAAIKVNNAYSICSVHFIVKISWKLPSELTVYGESRTWKRGKLKALVSV